MELSEERASKRVYDRSNPEMAQARGHNKRVRDRYPEIWAKSTITNEELVEWILKESPAGCVYCGKKVKEIDHKVPLSKGGEHSFTNLQMLCEPCNRSKRDMSDEEFRNINEKRLKSSNNLTLAEYGLHKSMLKDKMNRWRTLSLFKETTDKRFPHYYSLRAEEDTEDGLISVKRVYMDLADPTEYKIAVNLFGGLGHWRTLCGLPWFMEFLSQWRKELKAKIRSGATEKLISIADSSSQGALQALRTVITEDLIFKPFVMEEQEEQKSGAGRPKKVKLREEIADDILGDDAARIGL